MASEWLKKESTRKRVHITLIVGGWCLLNDGDDDKSECQGVQTPAGKRKEDGANEGRPDS